MFKTEEFAFFRSMKVIFIFASLLKFMPQAALKTVNFKRGFDSKPEEIWKNSWHVSHIRITQTTRKFGYLFFIRRHKGKIARFSGELGDSNV